MISHKSIEQAYHQIKNDVYKTPLVYSPLLSSLSNAKIYLKMEHLQHTGSFKIRGVLHKIGNLPKQSFNKTFVAASTGNHAAAFCYASEKFGFKGVLFLPEKTSEAKIKPLENYTNVKKVFFGKNSVETEAKAASYSKEIDGILIHPYNDLEIIKGQGTIGLEIKEQLPEVDTIIVPIGGGGLISGIASYFEADNSVNIYGCQPVKASEMYDSIQKDTIVPPSIETTIADAAAGGIEKDAITFEICKKLLSGIELTTEENIKKALSFVIKYHHTLIEPSSALPVSAVLHTNNYVGKNVVLVLTGKKIETTLLTKILNEYGNYY
ncbi:pyridoxal-phosphate dependent enzyme [Aquimarina sp. 2201CG5-10]|uniref:pyridoxal-phosphate dependent enzyme n=1 Tax=Aquimarina callyspongiae TaxID=3098150 RepID=UPI002AB462A0|nr:pyridoxal-phosphate dependent enzyme [Aquimarina sp. 2201CG5-10]MDY8135901.1 pyridoxal-phosphate dependent enzyme [Aquimarina sp. 2201CG5-10]